MCLDLKVKSCCGSRANWNQKRRVTAEKMPVKSLKGQRWVSCLFLGVFFIVLSVFLCVTLTCVLLCRYLHRFDSELEQIELMNGIKGRQGRLHGAREAVIKQTIERERAQYESAGFGEQPSFNNMSDTFVS